MGMSYSQLESAMIISTVEKLSQRVGERFPGRGLFKVSEHLCTIANESRERVLKAAQRILWIHLVIWGLVAMVLAVGGITVASQVKIHFDPSSVTFLELINAMNSGINDMVFVGVGIFFLFSLEGRIKRHRALEALHELRSLAHVIDMHQLTKDPQRATGEMVATASLPGNALTRDQLIRYLDYCSEMLSLVGKLAALYLQHTDDAVVLSTVDEIEELTTGLSGKIWQKMMIIQS